MDVKEVMSRMKVGDRVEIEGFKGTVKYMGSLEGSLGDWIGIEWDEEHRGKHDGIYLGRQYFECGSKKSCSFIRPSTKINVGRDFMSAFKERYDFLCDLKEIEDEQKGVSNQRDVISFMTIPFKMGNLKVVSVSGKCISYAGKWEMKSVFSGKK
jgi:dynactin complex subunit